MSPSEQDARFERWIRDHVAILHRVANGFATSTDRHDLMQELLLAVWKAVPEFRGEAKVSTFLYRVSHNAALPLVGFALVQLQNAGRMAPHEALSAAVAFAAILVVGTTVILLHRRLRLEPRQRRVEALLRQYASE